MLPQVSEDRAEVLGHGDEVPCARVSERRRDQFEHLVVCLSDSADQSQHTGPVVPPDAGGFEMAGGLSQCDRLVVQLKRPVVVVLEALEDGAVVKNAMVGT